MMNNQDNALATSDQRSLRDALRKFFLETVESGYRRIRIDEDDSSDDTFWHAMAALGLFPFFATPSGVSGGLHDLSLISFECGYALVPENIIDNLAAVALIAKSSESAKAIESAWGKSVLEAFFDGSRRIALAPTPAYSRTDGAFSRASFSGSLTGIPGADRAQALVVPGVGKDSSNVYLVRLDEGDVARKTQSTLDRTLKRFSLKLQKAPAIKLPIGGDTLRASERTLRASEVAGGCARVVSLTVDYVKTRKQFDVPIGTFEAVQHTIASMHVEAEALRSLANFAGWAGDSSPDQFSLAAAAALRFACDTGSEIIERAIQMHGGIGFTWEHDLHLFLRRAKSIESLYSRDLAEPAELLAVGK